MLVIVISMSLSGSYIWGRFCWLLTNNVFFSFSFVSFNFCIECWTLLYNRRDMVWYAHWKMGELLLVSALYCGELSLFCQLSWVLVLLLLLLPSEPIGANSCSGGQMLPSACGGAGMLKGFSVFELHSQLPPHLFFSPRGRLGLGWG